MTNRDWLERPFLIGHTNQKGIRGKIVSNERESRNQGTLPVQTNSKGLDSAGLQNPLKNKHICVTLMSGTINQYKINRLYCLLLICIKTSIFCVNLSIQKRNTPQNRTRQLTTRLWCRTRLQIGKHKVCPSCNTPSVLL